MEEHYWAAFVLVAAIACAVGGYLVSPEYVHLEESERTVLEDKYDAREDQWQTYVEECSDYNTSIRVEEEAECTKEKRDQTERLATRNEELLEINKGWQEKLTDLNAAIQDLNTTLADINLSDVNCWR